MGVKVSGAWRQGCLAHRKWIGHGRSMIYLAVKAVPVANARQGGGSEACRTEHPTGWPRPSGI